MVPATQRSRLGAAPRTLTLPRNLSPPAGQGRLYTPVVAAARAAGREGGH